MVEKKSTVGEESFKRLISSDKQEVGETSIEMNRTFEEELMKCLHTYMSSRNDNVKPFYIVVLPKKERLMINVVRRYFFGRESEPTPDYDQIVFKIDPKTQEVNFKWCIPDIETYHDMVINPCNYPLDQHHLVSFCKAMNENRLADYQKFNLVA